MTITWTNCTERMPPDDDDVIAKCISENRLEYPVHPKHLIFVSRDNISNFEWCPFTEEAWGELTR